jgi:predicted nucleic acid-binding protein
VTNDPDRPLTSGKIRAELHRTGQPIAPYMMIAGHAKATGLLLEHWASISQ